MADERDTRDTLPEKPKIPFLLLAVAVALLGVSWQQWISDNYIGGRMTIGLVVAAVLIITAFVWWHPTVHPSALRSRAEKIANDFRWWLGLALAFWAYAAAMNGLTEIRRNNEVVALRNDIQSITTILERNVLPRHLTPNQAFMLQNFLLRFKPPDGMRIAMESVSRETDVSEFSVEIKIALDKANWTVAQNSINPDLPDGISLDLRETDDFRQEVNRSEANPETIMMQAFGSIGLRLNGSGSGSGKESMLTIRIGRNARDFYVPPTLPPGMRP